MSSLEAEERTILDWRAASAELSLRQSPFIEGCFVPSGSDGRFNTVNPATGEIVCDLAVGCAEDVADAVRSARRAFEDGRWSKQAPTARKAVLLALADLVEQNMDELALLDSLEMGKAIAGARTEILLTSNNFRFCAEAADKLYGSVVPTAPGAISFSIPEPRGVVGAIVPWNFPLANAATKAAPALAAGNSVVLKPSEIASLSALRLAELAVEAGVPPGVFNVLPGLGATVGRAMGLHGDIDFLSFTGSTATGRKLMGYAADSNGKPLMLELGGKSAQIVCADMADSIPALAAQIAHDAFWNVGQWCAARTRLLVERGIHDALVEAVTLAARKYVPGHPLDPRTNFGTIATAEQFAKVSGYIESGQKEGADLVLDGARGTPCALSMGPSIFCGVDAGMTIAQEEIFGPVLSVSSFADFAEAVDLANATRYGLAATIWTRDARRGHVAARAIRAGKILVKADPASTATAGLALSAEPWAASGFGIERGMEGLRSYCRAKAIEMIF